MDSSLHVAGVSTRRPGIQRGPVHLGLVVALISLGQAPLPHKYLGFLRSLPILQCLKPLVIFRASFKRGQGGKSSDLSTDIMFFSVIGEHQEGKAQTFFFFVNL